MEKKKKKKLSVGETTVKDGENIIIKKCSVLVANLVLVLLKKFLTRNSNRL